MRDKIRNVLEILLAVAFIQGGVRVLLEVPVILQHPLSYLTQPWTIVAYGIMWIGIGLALLNSKVFSLANLHRWSLLAMFVTCAYVWLLSLVAIGFEWGQLLTIVCGIAAAWCWLEWKIKTEYVPRDKLTEGI